MSNVLTSILLLSGAALMLTAAIGAVRLPDLLCRAHAIAKATTLGIFLMLIGLWVHLRHEAIELKILLVIFFQVLTIPISSHLVALLAFQKEIPRWRERPMDRYQRPESIRKKLFGDTDGADDAQSGT